MLSKSDLKFCRGTIIPFYEYDLNMIAAKRKRNSEVWNELIKKEDVGIANLRIYRSDITYQTFPVIVKNGRRDDLYFGLNDAGFGAVSLYHELIKPLYIEKFNISQNIANNILNLPVHQDVYEEQIVMMYDEIRKILERN